MMDTTISKQQIAALTFDELVEHIRMSKINSDEYVGVVVGLHEELKLRQPTLYYVCKNCGHQMFEEHQLRAAGGLFSALFNFQTENYRVITCQRCKYSEMYQGTASDGQMALDLLIGG